MAVLALLGLAAVGTLNPLQGSLLTGVGGFLFLGAPFLWFIAGRGVVTRATLRWSYYGVAAAATASAVFGLAQNAGIYTRWDRAWVIDAGFVLGGAPRPFGFAASPGEYARMLSVATVVVLVGMVARPHTLGRTLALVVALPPLVIAAALSSVRAGIVYLVAALGVTAAVRYRARLPTVLVVGGLTLLALWGTAALLAPSIDRDAADEQGVGRQIEGLANPLDSTAEVRVGLLVDAVGEAVRHPAGSGTGVTTRAAEAQGTATRITESDLADAAVSWGLPGIVVAATVIALGFLTVVDVARRDRDWIALTVTGVYVVATLRWFNGGLYPLAPLVMVGLGWADRARRDGVDHHDPDLNTIDHDEIDRDEIDRLATDAPAR